MDVHAPLMSSILDAIHQLLRDGVLERSYTFQLTALTSAEYSAGLSRVRETANRDVAFRFVSDLMLYATEAKKPL